MENWLSENQIIFFKKQLMNKIVSKIFKGTRAKLFGGAVRDMILQKLTQNKDDCVPQDLDFFVTTRDEFEHLVAFVEKTFNITTVESKQYEGLNREVRSGFVCILNCFLGCIQRLCVKIDLVYLYNEKQRNIDFDINSLVMNEDGLIIDHLSGSQMLKIIEHIKAKKAFLLKQPTQKHNRDNDDNDDDADSSDDDNDEKDNAVLARRSIKLIERGWTIVTPFGEFSKIVAHTNPKTYCGFCEKQYIFVCSKDKDAKIELVCDLCFKNQFEIQMNDPSLVFDVPESEIVNELLKFYLD